MNLRSRDLTPSQCLTHGPADRVTATAVIAFLTVILSITRTFALDPGRALTQYNHRIWQTQQGLPQASVYALRQADDGFLWLGTQTGLVKFDGVRFAAIDLLGTGSTDRVWVRAIAEDRDHSLWAATDGRGLFHILHGDSTRFLKSDGLPSDVIQCVAADGSGNIWAGTDHGLARFSNGRWTVVGAVQGLSSTDIRAVVTAAKGKLWVAGPDATQIYSFDGSAFKNVSLTSAPPFTMVQSLLPGRGGQIWIGTSQGLFSLRDSVQRRITTHDGLASDFVYCLGNSTDGSLWVGTKDGFSRVRDDGIESFRAKDGLSQSAVFSITEDREGSLWVGTKHGLNQFLDRRAIPFTESEGLASNNTGAVFQDHNGTLWVGSQDAGLCQFDGRRFITAARTNSAEGLPGNRVTSLAEDSAGDLWAGGDRGVSRLRAGKPVQILAVKDGLASDDVTGLCASGDGVLWVGTSAGISTIRDGKLVQLAGTEKLRQSRILAVTRSGGSVIVATPDQIFRYDSSSRECRLVTDPRNPQRDVDALYEDHGGLLWIGTRGSGLRLIDGGRQCSFSIRNGLFDDDIYGIVVDDHDRLWMACSQGFFWVKRDDLRRFAAGQIHSLSSNPFSPTDNLRTVECQPGVQPVVCLAGDGKIWFSTARGMVVIDSAHLQRSGAVHPAVIEDVVVDGQRESAPDTRELSPGKKNLEFHYTALSFTMPTLMKFRYQLEGFDKDWIDAGTRREAFYTNLSPGKYRFKVMAANLDSGFGESPATVEITLLPRFYQRWWFLPSVAVIALAGAIAIYRQRMRRVRLHIAAILAERSRIARELHDTLLQGFSGVTMEMQALLMRLRPEGERTVLEGIIQDAAACMREARRSVAGLRSTRGEEGLAAAIRQSATQLTEATKVRLRLKLSSKLPALSPETEYNLLRVAHESVANAIKHSAASLVEVSLDASSGILRLMIRDDGRGFDPTLPVDGQHYGLIGIRERAHQINAAVQVESRPGKGTIITLRLPAKQQSTSRETESQNEPVAVED